MAKKLLFMIPGKDFLKMSKEQIQQLVDQVKQAPSEPTSKVEAIVNQARLEHEANLNK